MKRFLKSFRSNEKGFTLIELLVVIAILGILAAIIVPNFGKFFGAGQTEACAIEERMVKSALMAYVADNLGEAGATCEIEVSALSDYFESDVGNLMGTYTFSGIYPACSVLQSEPCPAP